jgi:hypothetical protein
MARSFYWMGVCAAATVEVGAAATVTMPVGVLGAEVRVGADVALGAGLEVGTNVSRGSVMGVALGASVGVARGARVGVAVGVGAA